LYGNILFCRRKGGDLQITSKPGLLRYGGVLWYFVIL
jgi:hypothetical protein